MRFSPDGRWLLSTDSAGKKIAWDSQTRVRLAPSGPSEFPVSNESRTSPDGCKLAVPVEDTVCLVDLDYKKTTKERSRREALARPKPQGHREQLAAAQLAANQFQAMFHAAWLMKIAPHDGRTYDELQEICRKTGATNKDAAPLLPTLAIEILKLPRGLELP